MLHSVGVMMSLCFVGSHSDMLQCYELAWRRVCLQKETISKAVSLAGERCDIVMLPYKDIITYL